MSDTVNDDYETPLTKQPKHKVKTNEIKIEEKQIINEKKPRKPKTEKQLEQFKKVVEARKKKVEETKLQKKVEASKLLLSQGYHIKDKKPKPEINETSSSSEEEQVIVVKKKKKASKKKKVIVVEESDSDSDSSITPTPPASISKSRSFKHQQNKKSVVKIHPPSNDIQMNNNNYKNYFI
jgi:hypothetical protein